MQRTIDYLFEKIGALNAIHGKKLRKNIDAMDDRYYERAELFFNQYHRILQLENKTLDYSIDCYLQMIADVNSETVEFLRTGKYTSSTFEEVNNRVYGRPETMAYYMHGLILSQFLWKHHYQMFDYFIARLPLYRPVTKSYLEVGVGHGFYLSHVLRILDETTSITAVDISETSLALAKGFINDSRIDYNLKDIFEFNDGQKYDFITLGEVLEHVERPLELLLKLNELLSEDGTLFFTTPTNAPAIDHIYLFNNVDEIRHLIEQAGFTIESELSLLSEEVSPEKAAKFKITVLYGAYLKKAKTNKNG
jgi:2-polyprenyl-3-methyl-5-hydroxy-6-metoxy-1,4-benzoquinol methylase